MPGLFLHDPFPKFPMEASPFPQELGTANTSPGPKTPPGLGGGESLLLCSGKPPKAPRVGIPWMGSLLLGPGPAAAARQQRPQAVPELRVHQGAHEDKGGAQPVPAREGVLEVEDGEDEADELAQRHHQGDRQGRALRGQDENAADADVPGSGS